MGSPLSPRSPSRLRSVGGLVPSPTAAGKGSRKEQLASLLGKDFISPPDVAK